MNPIHVSDAYLAGMTLIGLCPLDPKKKIYKLNSCGHEVSMRPSGARAVRRRVASGKKSYKCVICREKELSAIAEEKGLKIIGGSDRSYHKLYRFSECGHEQEISVGNVDKNQFSCKTCINLKRSREAEIMNLQIIRKGKTRDHKIYRFNECGHEQEIAVRNVKDKHASCKKCNLKKLKEKARNSGLSLIGSSVKGSYSKYRFNDCGHENEIAHCSVLTGQFICRECLISKERAEAAEAGLTMLGNTDRGSYRRYKFDRCGHEQEILIYNIKKKQFRCEECYNEKIQAAAKKAGLVLLLDKPRFEGDRIYRFDGCGHQQALRMQNVDWGQVYCTQCRHAHIKAKHSKEAAKHGLVLLGKVKNPSFRLYRFEKCNHKQKIAVSSVRSGVFICRKCEETSYDLPAKVYLLKITTPTQEWLKYGYAKSISNRIKQYGLPENSVVKTLAKKDFETGNEARKYEQNIHNIFKYDKLDSGNMKEFHENGFSECYPLSMKAKLINTLLSA